MKGAEKKVTTINGTLYLVSRKVPQYEECGCNSILVCAGNDDQAKQIAINASPSILQDYCGETEKDLVATVITAVNIGDVLCKG